MYIRIVRHIVLAIVRLLGKYTFPVSIFYNQESHDMRTVLYTKSIESTIRLSNGNKEITMVMKLRRWHDDIPLGKQKSNVLCGKCLFYCVILEMTTCTVISHNSSSFKKVIKEVVPRAKPS